MRRASEGRKAVPLGAVRSTAMYLWESDAVYRASGSGVWRGGLPIIISRMELEVEGSPWPWAGFALLFVPWGLWLLRMRCQRGAAAMERLLVLVVVEFADRVVAVVVVVVVFLLGRKRSVLETRSRRVSVEVRWRGSSTSRGITGSCLRPKARFVRQ